MAAVSKDKMEQIQDTPKDKSYWESQISESIKEFYFIHFECETTEQISKCSQNSFVAACEYTRRQCINKTDLMEYVPHTIQRTGTTQYNEQYSAETVEILANIYITLCFLYDKTPSVLGFSMLSGIPRQLLEDWVKEAKGVSSANRQDKQKSIKNIKEARALSLMNIAVTGGRNVVGAVACLNNETWNNQNRIEDISSRVLSLSELPDLKYPQLNIEDKTRSDAPASAGDAVGDLAGLAGLPILGVNTDI